MNKSPSVIIAGLTGMSTEAWWGVSALYPL